jgi:hypothetical protein
MVNRCLPYFTAKIFLFDEWKERGEWTLRAKQQEQKLINFNSKKYINSYYPIAVWKKKDKNQVLYE